MCGRTCLTLEPNEITKACRYSYVNKREGASKHCNVEVEPEYRVEFNCGLKYRASYNITPTDVTPVLVSSDQFCDKRDSKNLSKRAIVPMVWSMIPFWHKGDWRKHGLSTNNCRLEHLLESKLYQRALERGQRCVVLCEGFYEWQKTKSTKPFQRSVYLLHMPQNENIKIYDRNTWKPDNINLLKMAGLFDIWEDEDGDKIYCYSIITSESSKSMSWLHHRMPAILESEDHVNNWLDYKNVSNEEAIKTLRPPTNLQWYQVSNIVNNSRHKSDQCNKPIEIVKTKTSSTNKIMYSWLKVKKRKSISVGSSYYSDDQSDEDTTKSVSDSEYSAVVKRPCFQV